MLKKMTALLLCLLLCIPSMQIIVSAEAAVTTENDVNVAYVSADGSVTYEGKTYEAYTDLNAAIEALGTTGGIIRFSGVLVLNEKGDFITDLEGREALTIVGVGSDISKNVLQFPDRYGAIVLKGDLTFDNLTFKVIAGKELPIKPTGHTLVMGENIGVDLTIPDGVNDPTRRLHVYGSDSAEGTPADTVILNGGTYSRISLGSYWDPKCGKKIIGDPSLTINGGTYTQIFGGFPNDIANIDPAVFNVMEGSPKITINGGTIGGPIYAGSSQAGKIAGNSIIEINGGTIKGAIVAGNSNAKSVLDGNAAVIVNGGDLSSATLGNGGPGLLAGKDIYIINNLNSGAKFNDTNEAKYKISVIGGKAYPKFDGTTLTGFTITATNAIGTPDVFLDGEQISPISGDVYSIPEGKHEISIGMSDVPTVKNDIGSYIKGYDGGVFKPENNMTRAEAVTMLLRLIADEESVKGKFSTTFTDVLPGSWYYDNIAVFEAIGYLSGYSGTFSPDQNITRAEFVELVTNVSSPKNVVLASFSDVPQDSSRYFAISSAASAGLVNGYPDGTFKPDNTITRAEVVTVVNRLLLRTPTGNDGSVVFDDIADHWAKPQIVAASNNAVEGDTEVWQKAEQAPLTEFDIPADAKTADQMFAALNAKKSTMSADSYVAAANKIAEKMKSDVLNSPSNYPTNGTVYYVSPNGNDSNDGKSPEKAWKTITKVGFSPIASGDAILFERGGEWRGKFTPKEGVTYSAYGEGAKPIINGSKKDFADPTLWELTDAPNVYVLKEAVTNVGFVAFDHDPTNIGKYDKLVSTMMTKGVANFTGYKDMKTDLSHYSDLDTNKLYLYSDKGNPGERFKSIEIAEGGNIMNGKSNAVVDNLHLTFGGAHAIGGIGGSTNFTVRNCVIDWIGGSILKGYGGGNLVRYGNGVEVYGSCDGYYVENNWIYQIYDTPITHQYHSDSGTINMKNIKYLNNLIEYYFWGIEMSNMSDDGSIENLLVKGNYLRFGGYGWGCPWRAASAPSLHSVSMPGKVSNALFEGNIVYATIGKPFNISNEAPNKEYVWKDTTIIQYKDQSLGTILGVNYKFDKNALKNYKAATGDENPTFVYLTMDK